MLVSIVFYISALLSPLGLDWQAFHKISPPIDGYRYYYGDIEWGQVIYVSTKDILGLESEIQLYFYNNKISKSILILGPSGLDDRNCMKKYKKVVSLISEKYGKKDYILEKENTIANDLVYTSTCKLFLLGLREVLTFWDTKNYTIMAKLLGDEDGYYIEIEYKTHNSDKDLDKQQKSKIMKKI